MYKVPKSLEHYQKMFQKEVTVNDLKKYLIGSDKEYRITRRDSYMGDISDTEVILEYGVYPAFIKGYTQLKANIEEALLEMSNSGQALDIYQAVQTLNAENMLLNYYESLPFYLNRQSILANITKALKDAHIREAMVHYKLGEFAHYQDTMLDMVERTIETF
ncbi:TPA: NAD glycohydrolase inhibitor [Streptococcus pyogenes]|nr:NAD glycohydrolase inhibitor [Streptococcus pyogenes]